ncbi:MAG: DUF1223 domain-containing protein [Vicinamibacterales bacterium]
MRTWAWIAGVGVVAGSSVAAVVWARGPAMPPAADTPVLVELFTSEGCSSCPAADRLLAHLHARQPIAGTDVVALSEHVDYWNRLGWTDPFSDARFTARQERYAAQLDARGLYTPQAVIDGRVEVIGNDQPAVLGAVAAAGGHAKARLALTVAGHGVRLDVTVNGPPSAVARDLVVVIAEDDVTVRVARGENARKTLRHVGVARRMIDAGVVAAGQPVSSAVSFDLDPAWPRASLRVVAFAQAGGQGEVSAIGVAALTR